MRQEGGFGALQIYVRSPRMDHALTSKYASEHNRNMSELWTTDQELARLIEERARKGRMVHLRPETAERVAAHLLRTADPDPQLKNLGFRLEVWNAAGTQPGELLAAASTFALIRIAYDAARTSNYRDRLIVRQGIRIVLDSGPPDPPANVVRLR